MPTMAEFNTAFRRLTGPTGRLGLGWGITTKQIGNELALVENGKTIKSTPLFANGNGAATKEITNTQPLAENIQTR
ncbi:hypothetical protein COU37_05875 [Candidatus Micrarchaeota archaeon CG10_big_fil_rev_8_21_14_0_10_45_29]|nr:MAG: hypothetical protein COU37_05875 [Candidatus Micrarchaeota archaeon CG10_big_fil_rev_8_21_14_0_10_45_29]